jgi:hypothetical protein
MNDQQQTTLWIGSFRYYLGRQTCAVSDFCDLLIQEWDNLPTHTQVIIINELENAFVRDDMDRSQGLKHLPLGMDCDRADWQRVKDFIDV